MYYIEGNTSTIYSSVKEAFFDGCQYHSAFTIRQVSNDFPVWNYVTNKNTFINGWLIKSIDVQHRIREAFLENKIYYAYKPVSEL